MMPDNELQTFYAEMATAMPLAKCQKCGCMQETLDTLTAALPNIDAAIASELTLRRNDWAALMQPIQYQLSGLRSLLCGRGAKCFGRQHFPLAITAAPLEL